MLEQRCAEGRRRIALPAVAAGLAVGQTMARSGELLALSHAAQQAGSASLQRREATSAALGVARTRQRESAAARRHVRAVELGFDSVEDLLRAHVQQGASAWSMARELRCGNAKTIRRLLAEHESGPNCLR